MKKISKISRHHNIRLFSWLYFFFNFRLYSVLVVIYFAKVTGSYALALSLLSIEQITQAIFELPTGVWSDKYGRRTNLILGMLLSVLSVTCFAVGRHYVILVVGAVLQGMYWALFSGNNDALLYESLAENGQERQYHRVLGTINSNLELAGLLSTLLGGFVAMKSLSLMMWLSVLPQLIALYISFKLVEPKRHREKVDNMLQHIHEAWQYLKRNYTLRQLSLATVIGNSFGEASWSLQAAFYKTVLPTWAVSFVMSLNFLTSVISFRFSGRIIDRFKPLNLLIFQEVYSRILYFVALIWPTVASPFLLASASIWYGAGEVAKNTMMQAESTDKQRATLSSINSLVVSCLFALVAFLIGHLADRVGVSRALLIAQACLLPVILIYILLYLSRKK